MIAVFRGTQVAMLLVVAGASWSFLYGSGQTYVHFDIWVVITGVSIFMGTLLEVQMWMDRRAALKGK